MHDGKFGSKMSGNMRINVVQVCNAKVLIMDFEDEIVFRKKAMVKSGGGKKKIGTQISGRLSRLPLCGGGQRNAAMGFHTAQRADRGRPIRAVSRPDGDTRVPISPPTDLKGSCVARILNNKQRIVLLVADNENYHNRCEYLFH
jgi:hypothetical protein